MGLDMILMCLETDCVECGLDKQNFQSKKIRIKNFQIVHGTSFV